MVRKTIISVSAAGLLVVSLPWKAYSLGLGEITLRSGLNQSFAAEIALHAVRETPIEDIHVKLAPDETFVRAGIERGLVLSKLNFRPLRKETGETVVEVTSQRPIRVPFLDFLITVNWPQGHLSREYMVLLDPPFLFRSAKAATVDGRNMVESPPPENPETAERGAGSSAASKPLSIYGPAKPTDTLWSIAQRVRTDSSIAPQQMMLALLRVNPDAFLHGNINGLIAGKELQVPSGGEALKLNPEEAVKQVQQQNKAWAMLLDQGAAQENRVPAAAAGEQRKEASSDNESKGEVTDQAAQGQSPLREKVSSDGVAAGVEKPLPLAPKLSETQIQEKEDLGVRPKEAGRQVEIPQQPLSTQRTGHVVPQESREGLPDEQQADTPPLKNTLTSAAGESKVSAAVKIAPQEESKAAERMPSTSVAAAPAPSQVKPAESASTVEMSKLQGVLGNFMELKNLFLAGGGLLLLALVVLRICKRRMTTEPGSMAVAPETGLGESGENLGAAKKAPDLEVAAGEVINSLVFLLAEQKVVAEKDANLVPGQHDKVAGITEEVVEEEPRRQDLSLKAADESASAFMGLSAERGFKKATEDSALTSLELEVEEGIPSLAKKGTIPSPEGKAAGLLEAIGPELEFGEVDLPENFYPSDDQARIESASANREDGSLDFELSDFLLQLEAKNLSESNQEAASPAPGIQATSELLPTPGDATCDNEFVPPEGVDLESLNATDGDSDSSATLQNARESLPEDLNKDEMEAKLNLARAYIGMGNSEGAQSILKEVLASGNEDQRDTGQELLTQLAKAS